MTEHNEAALAGCPFCGGPGINIAGLYATCGAPQNECPMRGVRCDITAWNTRAPIPVAVSREEVARIINGVAFRPNHISGVGLSETEKEKWLRARSVAYYKADQICGLSLPHQLHDRAAGVAPRDVGGPT
jgi:hypothetical protein